MVVVVVKTVPRTSVGTVRFEEYEGRNDFDVAVEVAVVFGFID